MQMRETSRGLGKKLNDNNNQDSSVYEAMVRMAQYFKMRYPLIDGEGNMGSLDGDPAAAMRYTNSRLSRFGDIMTNNTSDDIVNFVPNFDDSLAEPSVLPTLFPSLLANGSSGVASAMATDIPPHHAESLYEALFYIIEREKNDEEIDIEELIKIVKAPDFPTGGVITDLSKVHEGYRTGRGRIPLRVKYEIEENSRSSSIVITEIPYNIRKSVIVQKIDEQRRTDEMKDHIKEVRDESDKDGVRVVVDLRPNANEDLVVRHLLRRTPMSTSVTMNMTAISDGRPVQFNLKKGMTSFLSHVATVLIRKTEKELKKNQARKHIIEGVIKALDNLEEVIEVIKKSESNDEIYNKLEEIGLTNEQARYVASMRLNSISNASRTNLLNEGEHLDSLIHRYNQILTKDDVLLDYMKDSLEEVAKSFKDNRRTSIELEGPVSVDERELIKEEDVIVTVTKNGVIKSVLADSYVATGRGAKGTKTSVRDGDTIIHMFSVSSKDDLLFMTNKGRCHVLEVFKIPIVKRSQVGRSIANYLTLEEDELVVGVLSKEFGDEEGDLLMATKNGTIKRLSLSEFSSRMTVTRVISFRDGDELVSTSTIQEDDPYALMFSANGQVLKIEPNSEDANTRIRPMGRAAMGVRGMNLRDKDQVVAMVVPKEEHDVLLSTVKGTGKRLNVEDLPTHRRGGLGVRGINITERTGPLVFAVTINTDDDLLIATEEGLLSRINTENIRVLGRQASGVKLINLSESDQVVSISTQTASEEDEEDDHEEEEE